jgi:hypothetical protein
MNPSTPGLILYTSGPGSARPDYTVRPGVPLVIGSPGLLIYKLYIYSPGLILTNGSPGLN